MRSIKLLLILLLPLLYAAESEWLVEKSTHFLVYYKNAPQDKLEKLIQKAEECYDSIALDLGFNRFDFWTWDKRAKIYLYDTQQEYQKSTGSLDWSGGHVVINNKVIKSFISAPEFLQNTLPHELGHIIFREMVGFNNPAVPLWLDEGVACFQEENISSVKAQLSGRIKQGDFLDLNALNEFQIKSVTDKKKIKLFYAEAYSLVKYLVTEFGKDQFVLFCQILRDDKNLAKALLKTYSFASLEDLQESWKKYILE